MRLKEHNFKLNYTMVAFCIPVFAILMVMLISGYSPFGKYSMLYSDMYHQYYPFFVSFRHALRNGESLLYSWDVGLGMDNLGRLAYYLASPLNLLSILVPESLMLPFFSLLVPVKLGLAAAFFAIMLHRIYGRNDLPEAVFGGFYGLCAWALGYQWNVMWLDSFALLPLVALGTVSLIRDKKYILYTVTLFFSVLTNYYIGFFTCIFVALLFFCYEICRCDSWKRFGMDLLRIAMFSVLAIGMTAFLTYSALVALQTTQSSVNAFPTTFRLNIADSHTIKGLFDAMRKVAGNMGGSLEPTFKEGLPNLYCGVGMILLAVLYLLSGDIRWRDKICTVGLLLFFNVSFIIRQLDYIWHGFHFTNMIPYRFSFLYSFVILYMAYRGWLMRRRFNALQVVTAAALTALILSCSDSLLDTVTVDIFGQKYEVYRYLCYNTIFLLAYTAALLYGVSYRKPAPDAEFEVRMTYRSMMGKRRVMTRWIAMGICVIELTATVLAFGLYFPGTNTTNYPKGTEEAASMIRYMHEREKYDLFYRAETTHSQTLNDGALNNYNGISAFTSSANVRVTEFMEALGYGAKNTYNRYCYEESSPVADLFLGIKYMIERDGRDRASTYYTDLHHYGKVHLLKNNYYLPLVFTTETALADVEFENSDRAFLFQNILFRAATGVKSDVWHSVTGENLVTAWGNGVEIVDFDSGGFCRYEDSQTDGSVTFSFVADETGFACIQMDLPKRNDFYVSVNGIELYRENISLPQMLAVKDVNAGDVIDVRIICKSGESSTMNVRLAILRPDVFDAGYERLSESTMKITKFSNTRVDGQIEVLRDGLLYTSVPDNGNWQLYIDNEPQEIIQVGDCMIASEICVGEHTVSLRYHNSAFVTGLLVSLGCAAVFAAIVISGSPRAKEYLSHTFKKKA